MALYIQKQNNVRFHFVYIHTPTDNLCLFRDLLPRNGCPPIVDSVTLWKVFS
jgi:hypothetical protein